MKVARSREYKVNMGNYEHLQVSAMIVIDDRDLFSEDELAGMDPDEVVDALATFAEKHLDKQLEPELKEAAEVSQASASMLIEEAAPSRRERTRRTR